MLTVVIKDNGEPKVTQFTYEYLWRELKDIPGSELIICEDWFEGLVVTKNRYICFVEADCLVSSGYFASQLGLLKKDPYFRKLAMLSSVTSVTHWANRFYGYTVDTKKTNLVRPLREKRSGRVDVVQIGYVPGSIIRVAMLRKLLKQDATLPDTQNDLVKFSALLSLGFWRQGDGNRVHLNPNATYVTTEEYVNDLVDCHVVLGGLADKFERESI